MNHVYQLVWNARHQAWVAVSEVASRLGGCSTRSGKRPRVGTGQPGTAPAALAALATAVAALCAGGGLLVPMDAAAQAIAPTALPQGGVVAQGAATLQSAGTANAPVLNINQSSQRAAINWNNFNLGAAGTVNFNQPNAQSATLNRVLDMNPTQILGRINAPGQVTIINPAGVYFSPGAVLDVGALTATTLGQTDADFMAGKANFSRNGATGSVVNAGSINARDYIALLAPEVRNEGSLTVATAGTVVMAGGEAVQLNFDAFSRLASITVTPSQIATLVENKTAVLAPGGLIILSARALSGLQASVINSGQIDASSMTAQGGRIVLEGDNITLATGSSLNASGATGGGTVLVGGDWQGSGSMAQATTVTMASDASIDASATQSGDGGKVVLWSDVGNASSSTTVNGSITARGGALGGNGGQVETSGHTVDSSGARINAGADQGTGGLWLIDPPDATITQGIADSYRFTLNGGGSVLNDVSGSITWNSGVTLAKTGGGAATLTLRTTNNGSITLNNASITSTSNPLNLVLWTRYNDLGGSGFIFLNGGNISTNGGNVSLSGGNSTTWNTLFVGGAYANTYASGGHGINLTGTTINTGGGNIQIKGQSYYTAGSAATGNYGVVIAGGSSLTTTGAGTIDIVGDLEGTYTNGSGVVIGSATATGNVTIASDGGAINITGTGADQSGSGTGFRHAVSLKADINDQVAIKSTSGAITLNGAGNFTSSTYTNDSSGLQFQTNTNSSGIQVVSRTGAINLLGSNTLEATAQNVNGIRFTAADVANSIRIGYDGSNAYSGNILIQSNSIEQLVNNVGVGSLSVQSTGTLTVQSAGNAFTYLRAGGSTLTFDNDWNFGTGLSAFTLGKSTNTLDLTLSNALSVAGPISIYGGNIALNANLTTTAAGGAILAKGSGNVTTGNNQVLQTNGGAITLWADSDANGGYILLNESTKLDSRTAAARATNDESNNNATTATGGGDITLGGGNGATAAAGYAWSTGTPERGGVNFGDQTYNSDAHTNLTTIYSGGGNIVVRGKQTVGTMMGINWVNGGTLNAGTGTVTLDGTSAGGNGIEIGSWHGSGSANIYAGGGNAGTPAITVTGANTTAGSNAVQTNVGSFVSNGAGGIGITGSGSGSGAVALGLSNLTSTVSGAAINVRATGSITTNNAITLATNNGALLLASDTDNSGGGIFRANGNFTANTTGGAITIGGGDASATGYATGSAADGVNANGVRFGGTTALNSGNGNISIKGKSYTSGGNGGNAAAGLWFDGGTSVNSGTGTVRLEGVGQATTSTNDYTMGMMFSFGSGATTSITSANTTASAITLIGNAATAANANLNSGMRFYNDGTSITATGVGGGITLTGTRNTAGNANDIAFANSGGTGTTSNILANGGAINLNGNTAGGQIFMGAMTLGRKLSTTVTSSNSNVTITADGLNNILAGTAVNTSGTLKVQPFSNNFSSTLTWPVTNLTLSNDVSGLTLGRDIGSTAHTDTITIGSATSIDGPISMYAGTINLNGNLTSTRSGAAILAKASGNISSNASRSFQTNNGDLIFWSNASNVGSAGAQTFGDSNTFNTANGAINQATGGGKIVMAGGLDDGLNGGTASDGVPDGFASSSSASGIVLGTTGTTSMYSGGGNILLRGNSTGSGLLGIQWNKVGIVDAGNGTVSLVGTASQGHGIELGASSGSTSITAGGGDATHAAISIVGTNTSTTSTTSLGIQSNGGSMQAKGGGGITVTGTTSASSSAQGTNLGMDALAASGPIAITGIGGTGLRYGGTLGKKALPNVAVSSSNVTLTGDVVTVNTGISVDTTGTLTVQPYSTSFTSALSWPLASFTVANVTGLTLGKLGNLADITVTANQSINGPISIYGGTVALNANLTSTASGAMVKVLASNHINMASSKSVTTQNGAVLFNSDADGSGAGGILLNTSATITSNGGSITLGGGAAGDGSGFAAGLGTDYSTTTTGIYRKGVELLAGAAVNAGGGNITVRGKGGPVANNGTDQMGIFLDGATIGTSNSGVIDMTGIGGGATVSGSNAGISLINSSKINSGAATTLRGTGGTGISTGHSGIQVFTSSQVNGGTGLLTLTGTGGTSLTNSNVAGAVGVSVNSATVTGGSGGVLVTGVGGTATGSLGNYFGVAVLGSTGKITSTGGDVVVTGTGGTNTGAVNSGVVLTTGGTISNTGGGNTTVMGTANTGAGGYNVGVDVNGGNITSNSGVVSVTGIPGATAGTTNYGVAVRASGQIATTSGSVVITTDSYSGDGTETVSAGTAGQVTVQNRTADTLINLGSADGLTGSQLTLGLSSAEINHITAGTLVVGRDDGAARAGNMTVSVAMAPAHATNLTLTTHSALAINAPITLAGTSTLTLTAGGNVSQVAAGNLTATNLLLNGAGSYALAEVGGANAVDTLAASGTAALSYQDKDGLTIGSVGGVNGINAGGAVSIASGGTTIGDLTVAQRVASANTGTAAIVLNAGVSAVAGTGAGGNIFISAGGSISTGGRATLYTGTVAGSTGLTTLVGSGSGNFRYGSDEAPGGTHYSAPLTNNVTYAIYREAPALAVTVNNATKTYDGIAYSGGNGFTVTSGLVNGDTLGATAAYGGTSQGKTNVVGSPYTITLSGLGDGLGYGTVTYTNGTLTINPYVVSITGNRSYNGSSNVAGGIFTLGTLVGSETLTLSGTGTVTSKNVGNGKTVTLGSLALGNGSGSGLASNYTLSGGTATANITQALLTVTAPTVTKTYDGTTNATGTATTGTVYSGDTLTAGTLAFTNKNAGIGNKTVNASGYTVSDGNGGSNYTISYVANTASTINKAALTVTAPTVTKTYDGTTNATGTSTVGLLAGAGAGETVSSTGTLAYTDKNAGSAKTVHASGLVIKDSGNVDVTGNYTVSYTDDTASVINKAALTVTAPKVTKTYDGTTNATGTSTVSLLAGAGTGETVSSTGTLAYTDKDAGTDNKTVQASGLVIKDSGNVDVTGNYNVSYTDNTASTINKATLTVGGITASDKTYDGTTAATVNTASATYGGLVSGETLSTSATGSFGDKNAATGKTVTLSSSTRATGSTLLSNYTVTEQASTTADISKAAVTVTAPGVNKTYDGTTNAPSTFTSTVDPLAGASAGETVSSTGTLAYTNKDAGINNKTVQASGLVIKDSGNVDVTGNYNVSYTDNTTSTITKAPLTVTAVDASRFVTQSDTANFQGVMTSPYVNGESAASAGALTGTAAVTRTNAGTNVAAGPYSGTLVPSGLSSSNYEITYVNGNFTIVPAGQLLITVPATTNTYGSAPVYGTPVAQYLDGANVITTLGAPTVVGNQYTYNDGAGGTAVFTLNPVVTGSTAAPTSTAGLTRAGAYNIGSTNISTTSANFSNIINFQGSQTVTTKGVTASANGVTKPYDGTTTMAGATVAVAGKETGDLLGAAGTGAFDSKNAGTNLGYSVSGLALTGADKDNYYLTGGSSITGSNGVITPAALTLSTTDVSKTYDGTTSASGSLHVTGNTVLFAGDSVSGGSFAFTNKNASVGDKAVSVSGATVSDGNSGGNYAITYVNNTTSTISKATLNVTASTVIKTYDGTTSATGTATVGTLAGAGAGEVIDTAATQAFTDKNAGTNNKTVVASGLTIKDSGNADVTGNYTITYVDDTASTINKADLTVSGITATSRAYNGTTAATTDTSGALTGSSGLITGDVVSVTSATGTFADKNVANGKTVTLSGFQYGGADVANYNIIDQATTTADITQAALTITAPTVSKTYDGTTSATGTATTGTVYSGDTVTAGTLAFADKNAGSGNKTVNASGYTVSDGSNSGNYAITYVANTVSTITPATLTVSGITAADKAYDGTTSATVSTSALTGTSGLIAGDDVSVSATGAFGDKNAANGKTVTLTSSYSGADVANYTITNQATTTASIAPKQVTISGVLADTKAYDATTAATLSTPGSVSTGVGSETLTLSAGSASFADADAGVGKTVTASGYTLGNGSGGGLASNYVLTSTTATGTGTIDRAVLTVSANDASKVYDGAAYSGGNGVTYSAFAIGETAAVLTGSVAYTGASQGAVNAGTYAIDLSTSTLANANYTVTYSAGALNIARRPLALVGSHVYDGQTSLTATEVSASNLVAGDCSSGVASCGLSGFGLLGSANVNAGSQVMNVGNFAVGGSLAQNYTMTDATGTASVTPRTVTVSGMTTTNKTYNGNTDATAIVDNWGTANTGVGAQTLTLNHGSAAFASANAASNLTVTLGGYSLANATDGSGGLASNYQLASTTATTTASILQAPLRVYANNDAKFVTKADAAGYAGATITGFAPGETEAVLTSAPTITRSNAGTDTAGIYTGVLTASGVSAANYYVEVYVPGNYTVVPANQLLVRATPASNSYGVANPYAITSAEYFDGANVLTLPTATANGANSFTVNDGAGGSASFTLAPQAAVISGAGLLSAGSYQLGTSGAVSTVNPANFSNTVTVVGSHTVSPALLTANASGVSKVYDGGTSMSNVTLALAGLQSGDVVSVNGSGAFSQSNAGTGLAYSISGLALGGNDAGNYQLSNAGGLNGNNGSITPRTLVVTADNQTKVYDKQVFSGYTATLSGNGSAGSGFATGETLADLGGSLAYGGSAATAVNAGSHAIQASGLSANNYSFSYVDGTLQITPAALTLSSANVSKAYDGTTVALGTAAVASGASGTLFGGDSLSGGTFAFTDKNAGTGKTVTASGITVVDGNGGNNYLVTYVDNTTSIIRQANLVLTTSAVSKEYDGTTTALGAAAAVSSGTLFDGDSLSGGSFAFTDKNAGTGKTVTTSGVTVGDGTNNSNYAVTYVDNTASRIDQANIVLTTDAVRKDYDGTTTARGTAAVSSGRLFDGDSLSGGSFAFTDKNAGTGKTVTTSGVTVGDGTNNSNYAVTYVDNTASRIDQANIVLTTNAVSKAYDGTTSAPGAATVSSGTLFSGDSLSGGTFTFADKNAGTGKTLTTSGVTVGDGTNNSNYAVTYVDNTASRIDQANIVLTTSAVSKGYDGTTTALGTAAVSSGTLFSGDSLSGGTFAFTDKNVGSGKAVTASGVTVADGNGGGNYAISYANNTASSIAAAAVSVTAPEVSKTYDGTTNATGNAAIGSLAGAAGGDRVAVAPTVRYTDKDAGVANKTTRATGMTILDGNGVDVTANYTVSYVDTTTSTISPAPLTVTANADARFVTQADTVGYYGAHFDGLAGGETSAVLGGTLAITRANAGTDVAAGSYTGVLQPSGLSSGNYNITYLPGNYSIVPANKLLVRVDNTTTTYGTAATPSITSVQYLDADNVTIHTLAGSGTGSSFGYSDGAGGGIQFTLSPVGATTSTTGKTNVGNYALADAAPTVTGNNFSGAAVFVGNLDVQQKSVSTSAAGVSKTYNGSTDMVGISLGLAGLEAGDRVLADGNGAFAQQNASSNLQYLVRDLVLSGPDAGNYYLVGGNSLAGNNGSISPAAITVTTGDVTKTYDGNTGAPGSAVLAAGQLFGSDALAGGSFAFDNKNVGTGKTVTPSGVSVADGNGGGNYSVTYVANTNSSITRLDSVTWIGGPTGNWFDPANWAGGAVPDLANVANVVIPGGVNVVFGTSVVAPAEAGPVQVNSIGSQGSLAVTGGQLEVGAGGITLAGLTQSGGGIGVLGNTTLGTFNQTGGSTVVGGDFSTTTGFTQGSTGTLAVGGGATIGSTSGNVVLGNLESTGPLVVNNTGGAIVQAPGTTLVSHTDTSLSATNNGVPADIQLTNPGNDFQGPVSANGGNVALTDANGLTLGTVTATGNVDLTSNGPLDLGTTTVGGNLNANSGNGDITQTGPLLVAGAAVLDAGSAGIALSNPGNRLNGAVSTTGSQVAISGGGMPQQAVVPKLLEPFLSLMGGVLPAVSATAPANTSLVLPANGAVPVGGTTVAGTSSTGSGTTGQNVDGNREAAPNGFVVITPVRDVAPQVSGLVEVQVSALALRTGAFDAPLPERISQLLRAAGGTAGATLVDGDPLPVWLRFDPQSLTFTARNVPAGALPLMVLVRAGSYRVEVEITELP